MKKIIAIAVSVVLVLAIALSATFYFINKKGDGEIAIKADAMPQLVHVLGEELDLSNGMLEFKIGKESGEVALNADGVTVSGYDKNKLGEQTVTVTYKGYTTTLAVTVVERMIVEDAITDYLAGDSFDVSRGRVKITRDDGTVFTAIFNSDKVTVSGFDGNSVGQQTLTVTYANGGTTYTCQFPITVYAVDSVTLKEPNKPSYNSHDEGIVLTGGSLTLKGNNNTLVRVIPLDHEGVEITGFDLSVVNADKRTAEQTITVTYNSITEDFKITLIYTDVSMFKDSVADFADFVWSGTAFPEISDDLGEYALELMEIYMDFSPAEKSYITEEEHQNVARVAFLYGLELVNNDLAALEGGFTIENGNLGLTCRTREGVEATVAILQDTDSDLYRISDLLYAMSETYAGVPLFDFGEESILYFDDFALADSETYLTMLSVFEHMLQIADEMEEIPADWAEQGIAAYEDVILDIYEVMFGYGYASNGWGQIYVLADAWNDDVDVFDLMYEYYYFGEENYEAVLNLTTVRFPSGIDQIVTYIGSAMDQMSMLSDGYIDDPSLLMYYYYAASELAESVKKSNDEKLIELYDALPVNGLLALEGTTAFFIEDMLDYLCNYSYSDEETATAGIYYYLLGVLGMPEYDRLMAKYVDIIGKLLADTDDVYVGSADYGNDIEEMFALYLEMSPMQQYNFLCALTPGYYEGYIPLAFSYYSEFYTPSLFVNMINGYYRSLFSTEEGTGVYQNLINAIELYTLRFFEGGLDNFKMSMGYVADGIEGLSTEDKAAFNTHLKDIYEKYKTRLAAVDATPDISATLGEWEDDFLALQNALINVELAYYYNSEEIVSYSAFISAFEKAQRLYYGIVDNAPDDIVEALYRLHIYGLIGEENDGELYDSFDYTFNSYRNIYIYYLLTILDGGIYDSYVGSDLQEFMYMSNELIWVYLWNEIDEGHTYEYDAEAVWNTLKAFTALDSYDQFIALIMDGTGNYYYGARDAFFDKALTANAAAAAKKLLEAEEMYIYYFYAGDSETRAYLDAAIAGLNTVYSDFTPEDTASFEPLQNMYYYYINMYEAITALFDAYDLTENAFAVGIQLFDVQQLYWTYICISDADGTDALEKSFAQLTEMYAQLTPDDIQSFASLQDIYDSYVALCEALLVEV